MNQRVVSGAAVKAIREAKGLSLRDIADATGVHHSFIDRIEKGQRHPNEAQAAGIARALGVPIPAISFATRVVIVSLAPETDAA